MNLNEIANVLRTNGIKALTNDEVIAVYTGYGPRIRAVFTADEVNVIIGEMAWRDLFWMLRAE